MLPGEGRPENVVSWEKQDIGEEGGQGPGEGAGIVREVRQGEETSSARRGKAGGCPSFPIPFQKADVLSVDSQRLFSHRFTTKKGRKVCADPKEKWVQKYISSLRAQQLP